MKSLVFLLLFPLFSLAQKTQAKAAEPSGSFVIKGLLKNVADSTLVFISRPGAVDEVFATAYTKNGNFTLFGKLPHADVYQVAVMGVAQTAFVFIGNENISLSGSTAGLDKVQVTGSAFHPDYVLYKSRFTGLEMQLNQLARQINQTQSGLQRDSLIGKFEASKQLVLKQVSQFIKEKPASPVTAFLIYVTSPIGGDASALEARYDLLRSTAQTSYYAQELQKMIMASKIGMEGTQAVDFTQPDVQSKPVSLSQFKGKYVLVDFWASWCGPCRMENPAVVAAYNAFKDRNFTVFGVSLDQSKDKWLKAIEDDKLAWTQVSDLKFWQNEAAQLYKIGSIPANMLIDPSGKIIARNLRGEDLYKRLQQELK